jgi:hypothetical protein
MILSQASRLVSNCKTSDPNRLSRIGNASLSDACHAKPDYMRSHEGGGSKRKQKPLPSGGPRKNPCESSAAVERCALRNGIAALIVVIRRPASRVCSPGITFLFGITLQVV